MWMGVGGNKAAYLETISTIEQHVKHYCLNPLILEVPLGCANLIWALPNLIDWANIVSQHLITWGSLKNLWLLYRQGYPFIFENDW